jgi:hypothetical protein
MHDDDDTGQGGGQPSDPFPTGPDPFFAPTKAKQKKAIKTAIPEADPNTAALGKGLDPRADPSTDDDALDIGDIGGKDYKFKEVSANPEGTIQDYSETTPLPYGPVPGDQRQEMNQQLQKVLGGTQNAGDISPHEYAALTKEASKGNKLAQKILVEGKFKAQDYPDLQQDLNKIDDPFVNALSGLPALAQNEQAQANKVTQPYDFSNAEAQVNNLLGQMGSSQQMTTSPETNQYLGTLQGIVSQGANNLTTSNFGLPSIMQALGGLGPAAKESVGVSGNAALLAALLSHQQYEDIYGTGLSSSTSNPAWLQNLIASVVGQTGSGSLVSPELAAGEVGSTPSTASSPTGSNA